MWCLETFPLLTWGSRDFLFLSIVYSWLEGQPSWRTKGSVSICDGLPERFLVSSNFKEDPDYRETKNTLKKTDTSTHSLSKTLTQIKGTFTLLSHMNTHLTCLSPAAVSKWRDAAEGMLYLRGQTSAVLYILTHLRVCLCVGGCAGVYVCMRGRKRDIPPSI